MNWNRRDFVQAGLYATGLISFTPELGWPMKIANNAKTKDRAASSSPNLSDWEEKIVLALQHEHGAIVQYINHSGKLKASGLTEQSQKFQSIIHDEVAHAQTLVHILAARGVEPTLAVWPPNTDNDTKTMLKQDVAAEQGAIALYQEILKNDLDADTYKKIHVMLKQEIAHKKLLDALLRTV
jgi:bacterioferritin (cytochrome b1)